MNTDSSLPGRRHRAIAVFCAALTTLIFFSPVAPATATNEDPPPASETSSAPAMWFGSDPVVGQRLQLYVDVDQTKRWERISHQWLVDGEFRGDPEASNSLTVTEAHFGHRLSVRVTMKEFGADPVVYVSGETAPVLGSISPQASYSSAEAILGKSISIDAGQVSTRPALASAPQPTFVWSRNGIPIPGADGASYTPTEDDMGAELTSTFSLSAPDYQTETYTRSYGTAFRGYLTSSPVITWTGGDATTAPAGTVLHATTAPPPGGAPPGLTYQYQWIDSYWGWLHGETGPTFTTTARNVGSRITVQITTSAPEYKSTYYRSKDSAAPLIKGVFAGLTAPTIKGTVLPGQVLTAVPASTTPAPERVEYEWYRSGAKVTDWSRSPTYQVTQADSGHRMSVRVRYSKALYITATVLSALTPVTFDTRSFMDFTGDKKSDVLVGDNRGIYIYPGNGSGGWGARKTVRFDDLEPTALLRPGNFDGDSGFYDYFAVYGSEMFLVSSYSGSPVGIGWEGFTIVAPGDFNGDGYSDVVARDKAGALYLYPGNGSGGWKARAKIGSGWHGFTAMVGPGDFNGDQYVDVIARDKYGALYLYPGNGSGGWKPRTKIGSGWLGFTSISAAGDFNGDGTMDLVARDKYGALYLYPGNGSGGWKPRAKIGSGWNGFTHIS
ncbi:hypothetical protein GC088_09895 [Arthrobacter sp. JZ12]|uniref:FG-GAP repeat domain-containing protein n=1 Tax=Arthrobacter sp. JZ12 TaxID=2654190 RepID=UPI002B48B144|nr:VCBS repeat-containing protein [Arthrobacter sp. JZ12]WRH25342.1 hypothetical protein GC088_09895 [Arthrobacter sp. JZ12]